LESEEEALQIAVDRLKHMEDESSAGLQELQVTITALCVKLCFYAATSYSHFLPSM